MIRIIDWVMVVCGVLIWAILSGLGVWMLKEKGVAYAWGGFLWGFAMLFISLRILRRLLAERNKAVEPNSSSSGSRPPQGPQ